jgi:NitT/TauT family transport system permease protein
VAEAKHYFSKSKITMAPPNRWDFAALGLIFGIIALIAYGTKQMAVPYHLGQTIPISLNPINLPEYALRTVLRMFFALICSLLFTFIFATWAAKSKQAGRIIIPVIDICQSLPVLGFLSLTIVGFISLFHGSLLGPECAAIFAVFTAQVWNMALSFYQSLRTVPDELIEAADVYHLSAWQKFWRVEVPFAMPALLWNTMMSMSASWFFVVASEAISVANQQIYLPGIGSYIYSAIQHANGKAVVYAIVAMFLVILIYDQILFRPLVKWAEKFRMDTVEQEGSPRNWLIKLFHRSFIFRHVRDAWDVISDALINLPLLNIKFKHKTEVNPRLSGALEIGWNILVFFIVIALVIFLLRFIVHNESFTEIIHVFMLGLATAARVFGVIVFCTIVWVPLGVWIGLRPRIARIAQPTMQFLAAFPAYLLFPVLVILIVKFHLNAQIWVTPLMILGTQWYVAFNVIAGTLAIPKDLHLVSDNLGIKGWLKWQRLILPGIFPYYVTGAITAVGGAWNTSMVVEVVSWGQTTIVTTGLGAFITENSGNYPRIALGMSVMGLFVLVLNRLLWRPLYKYAEKRFRLE